MFRTPSPQNTRRAHAQTGHIVPLAVPVKGLNARDAFAVMGREYAIALTNVIVESYGIKTRKGYSEWAKFIPGAGTIWTMMSYYPSIADPAPTTRHAHPGLSMVSRMLRSPRAEPLPPAGKMFAAKGGFLYDITAGGAGPWVAEAGVGAEGISDFWTWRNFQNVAGAFLLVCNNDGGYSYYNGAAWATPAMGADVGQIDGIDPAKFVYVMEFKKRLWFIEKESTRAWYLPVSQIAGAAKEFNFGEQFAKGGKLVALVNWTVDGGAGVDDHLVAISSQGDVVIYKGTDPDDPTGFFLHGVWNVGPLPLGFRSVSMTGGDIHILSQFGVTPLSALLNSTQLGDIEGKRITYVIAPLLARLMRDYATLPGWQVMVLPSEELLVVTVPPSALEHPGDIFALKITNGAWSMLRALPYTSFVNIDSAIFAGLLDGRVARAFDGPYDNVLIGENNGEPITCQVTPSYQPMGAPGVQKRFPLVRPTFLTAITPSLTVQVLTDYGPPRPPSTPTLPVIDESLWDQALWDAAHWAGLKEIKKWLGCSGVGFVATAQLDYRCSGDTLLASVDFWAEQGGVM